MALRAVAIFRSTGGIRYLDDTTIEYLAVRRNLDDIGYWSGRWFIPGGAHFDIPFCEALKVDYPLV